jgi:hypothetical protein
MLLVNQTSQSRYMMDSDANSVVQGKVESTVFPGNLPKAAAAHSQNRPLKKRQFVVFT